MLMRWKTTLAALALCVLGASCLCAEDAAAEPVPVPERTWALDVGVESSSRYLFRGVSLLGDERVFVPHARYGIGRFAVYYYGYLGSIPGFRDDQFRESDLGADATFTFGERVAVTVGAVTYQYNRAAERDIVFLDTYEVYAIVAIDTVLTPTISFYRDVDAVKGGFLSVGVSQAVPLGARVRAVFSGAVGFDFGYNNPQVENGTFNDVLLGVDLPIRVTDALSMHAMVQHSIALRALDRFAGGDRSLEAFYGDHTVLSAGLSYSF